MIAQLNAAYLKTRPMKAVTRLMSYALFEGRPVTTKGRWINPIVFSLLKTCAATKHRYAVPEKPIFILGTGRSGTTILGIVLSMHRHVGYLNEPKAIWHLIHPHEDVIGNYSQDPATYRFTAEDATDPIRHRAAQLFGAYLTATRSKRLVDKYPELIFRVDFVRQLFPDARFIFLVRNGWDTCHSIANWSERLGVHINGEKHDWWGVDDRKWRLLVSQLVKTDPHLAPVAARIERFAEHRDRAAVEWTVTMREGLRVMETDPPDLYRLRFEDLCADPDAAISALATFCELSTDTTFHDYACRTLQPVPPRTPFDPPPEIAPLFHETMAALGYGG